MIQGCSASVAGICCHGACCEKEERDVKTVKDLIIETLDDLKKGDLERFKNKLRDKTFQGHRIGAGKLEDASRVDIADRIVDTFTEQYAVALTVEVLNEIGQNEPARVLQARTAA